MKEYTLVFVIDSVQNRILLGMKKRGFGSNKWNGFGGKIDVNETVIDAAKRELQEECGLIANEFTFVADNTFTLADGFQLLVHTFICRDFTGEPKETDEMNPKWFDLDHIPYDTMWDDDKYWLPQMLSGKVLECSFSFDANNKVIGEPIILKKRNWN